MRKRIIAVIAVFVVSLCGLAFAACSDDAAKTYTVTYHANGGVFDNGNIVCYEKVEEDGYAKGAKTPENSDSELLFIGWGLTADATSTVKLSDMPITKNTDLYAVWHDEIPSPTQHTVTFYYNYVGAPESVFKTAYVDDGEKVQKPTTAPTRVGYDFNEWHTSANNDVAAPYSFSSPVKSTLKLYAHWTEKSQDPVITGIEIASEPNKTEYVVGQTFSDEGLVVRALYSGGKQPETLVKGTDYTVSEPDMQRAGKQTVTVTHTTATGVLTAKFEITVEEKAVSRLVLGGALAAPTQEVGVTFNPAGLTFKAQYNDGSEVPLAASDITFASALLGEDGKFTAEGDAEITASYDGVTSATKLHVTVEVPAVPKHDVIFNANITAYAPADMPAAQRIEEGAHVTAPAVEPSINGYTFGGWYIDAECIDRFDFDNDVVSTADVYLYAEWTANVYTVTYEKDGGDATNVATYTVNEQGVFADVALNDASKGHNTFDGWYTGSAFPESGKVDKLSYAILPEDGSSITLYAKFTPETYSLAFDLGGSADTYSAEFKTGVTPPTGYTYGDSIDFPDFEQIIITPLAAGDAVEFNFLGWYLSGDASKTHVSAISITDYGDKTFIADIVQAATHTVTFDMNYAGSTPRTVKVIDGQKVSPLNPAPPRVGYTLDGWYADADFGAEFDFDAAVEKDRTAYAKWNAVKYTVVYELPDGSDNTNNAAVYYITDGNVALYVPNTLPAGWKFLGWFTNSGCTNAASSITPADITRANNDRITFYARVSNKYTVTFDGNVANGEVSGVPESVTVTYNNAFIEPTAPVREGWIFRGWYKEEQCNTAWDFDADKVTEDITLFAKWEIVAPTSIKINAESIVKTEYFVGEVISLDGLILDVSYNNGTRVVVSFADHASEITFETSDANIEADGTIKGKARSDVAVDVKYLDLTDRFTIRVSDVLTGITVDDSSVKNRYIEGDVLDLTGIVVTAVYNAEIGETVNVVLENSEYTTSPANGATLAVSNDEVTVSYNGKTDSFAITVAPLTVVSIAVSGELAKSEYCVGDDFDANGLIFTATYNNNTTSGLAASAFTFNGGKKFTAAGETIAVSAEYTANTAVAITGMPTVKVIDKLSSVTVTAPNKATYPQYADAEKALAALDKTGMVVTARYNEGIEGATVTTAEIDLADCTVTADFSKVGVGAGVITLSYTENGIEKTATVNVDITAPAVTSIAATVNGGASDTYFVGDGFSLGNITFTATYDNGDSKVLPASEFTVTPFAAAGKAVAVEVTYTADDAIVISGLPTVKVVDKLTGLTSTAPDGLHTAKIFVVGDTVTTAGMTVTAFYNGDTENGKAVTAFTTTVADLDMSTAGEKTITVSYTENGITKTATVRITVVEKAITALTVSGNPVEQYKGALFNKSGLTFTAVYNNDETADVAVEDITFTCSAFRDDNTFRVSGEHTVVAAYEGVTCDIAVTVANIDKFTVTFDDNIAAYTPSGIPAQISVQYGESVPTYADPTLKGFTFGGWYKEADCATEWDFATATVDDNMTLYAKWTANSYVVNFYQENGLVISGKQYAATDNVFGTLDLMTVTPDAKEHYNFVGWYIEGVQPQKTITALTYEALPESGTTLSLKPVYEIQSYTVTYVYGNGEENGSENVDYNGKATEPEEPTREHYTFGGWFADGATDAYDFDTAVTADITLTAAWNAVEYSVEYSAEGLAEPASFANGGNPDKYKITDGAVILENATTTELHKSFIKWTSGGETVTELSISLVVGGKITLTAVFDDAITHNVTFDSNGGSAIAPQVIVDGAKAAKPADPTKPGHTFDGWFKGDATTAFDFDTAITEDVALVAHWTAKKFTVTFDSKGGSAVAPDENVVYDTAATKPADPTKTGNTFKGWFKDEECTSEWDFDLDTVKGDTTLYAKWETATYDVTFDLMYEGAPAIEKQSVAHGGNVSEPTKPTREDYEFMGWFKDEALKTVWYFDTDTVTENTVLYAKWMALTNKFMLVNGATQLRMYDNTVHNTDTAVKEEYTLLGTELNAGDKLTFKTREDGVLNAIAFEFDDASKGVTYANNTLTTKSEGVFDIYLKLLKTGKWKVYASGGAMLDGDYYIAGTVNEWATDNADYKLDNTSGAITLDLPVNAKFKVINGNLTGDDRWLGYYFAGTTTSRLKAGADYVQADGENNFQIKESAKYKLVFDGEYLSVTRVGDYEGEPVIVMPEYSAMFKFKDGKSLIIKLGKMPVQTATDWQGLDTNSAFAYAEGVTTWDNRYKLNGSTYTVDKDLSEVSFMIGFMQWSDGKNTAKIACTDFVEGKVNVVNSVNNYGSWTGSNWNYTLSTEEIVYA